MLSSVPKTNQNLYSVEANLPLHLLFNKHTVRSDTDIYMSCYFQSCCLNVVNIWKKKNLWDFMLFLQKGTEGSKLRLKNTCQVIKHTSVHRKDHKQTHTHTHTLPKYIWRQTPIGKQMNPSVQVLSYLCTGKVHLSEHSQTKKQKKLKNKWRHT